MVLQQLKLRFESNSFPHVNYCHQGYIGLGHYDDGYVLKGKKPTSSALCSSICSPAPQMDVFEMCITTIV
jgi:hypothetical protein